MDKGGRGVPQPHTGRHTGVNHLTNIMFPSISQKLFGSFCHQKCGSPYVRVNELWLSASMSVDETMQHSTRLSTVIHKLAHPVDLHCCTGWAKKTGPFLKVYDSCI